MTAPALQSGPVPDMTAPALQSGPVSDMTAPALQSGPVPDMTAPALQSGPVPDMTAPALQSGPVPNHWPLREEAARLAAAVCSKYGQPFYQIQSRIVKALNTAWQQLSNPLTTHYGESQVLLPQGLAGLWAGRPCGVPNMWDPNNMLPLCCS